MVIPAIVAAVLILTVGIYFFTRRRPTEESSSDQDSHAAEAIADAVADSAAEMEQAEGEDAAFEEDEGEAEDSEEEDEDEDANYEPACNDHMTLGSVDPECTGLIQTKLKKMPPLPRATLDLLPMLSSPRTSARDIASVISNDPLLGGMILKRVNSCFYALHSKIDSIQHAIALLGFDNIRAISLRESFSSMLAPEAVEELSANLLWRHMAAVGLLSKHLSHRVRGVDEEMVASTALMHDIGILLQMAIDRDGLSGAIQTSLQQRRPFCECEEELYGFNHQVLGGMLCRNWNLSDELCDGIGRHHSPIIDDEVDKVSGIIWLSHTLAYQLGFAHRMAAYSSKDGKLIAKALGLGWPVTKYVNEGILRELQKVLSLWDTLAVADTAGSDVPDSRHEEVNKY